MRHSRASWSASTRSAGSSRPASMRGAAAAITGANALALAMQSTLVRSSIPTRSRAPPRPVILTCRGKCGPSGWHGRRGGSKTDRYARRAPPSEPFARQRRLSTNVLSPEERAMNRRDMLTGAFKVACATAPVTVVAANRAAAAGAEFGKAVYHLSDLDKVDFVFGNIRNHYNGMGGPDHVTIALVVHGPALKAFHLDGATQEAAK